MIFYCFICPAYEPIALLLVCYYYCFICPAYEQAVREQKMRTEISQAKRENTHYLQNVEKGKEIQAIVERKRKRGVSEDEVGRTIILKVGIG